MLYIYDKVEVLRMPWITKIKQVLRNKNLAKVRKLSNKYGLPISAGKCMMAVFMGTKALKKGEK